MCLPSHTLTDSHTRDRTSVLQRHKVLSLRVSANTQWPQRKPRTDAAGKRNPHVELADLVCLPAKDTHRPSAVSGWYIAAWNTFTDDTSAFSGWYILVGTSRRALTHVHGRQTLRPRSTMTQHTPVDAPAPAPASFPSSPLPHDREVRRESCSRSVPLQEGAVGSTQATAYMSLSNSSFCCQNL